MKQNRPEKFCVFCGNPPTVLTKEHVLPEWLLKMTGDPNRIAPLHFDLLTGETKEFAFSHYRFPACKSCNEKYGDSLEAPTKAIMEKLLNGDSLNTTEYDILLDWFDKVRVGLWLATYYLDSGNSFVRPRFYISSRIGKKDRVLLRYEFPQQVNSLKFIGTETILFKSAPSVFGLSINNYIFVNISADSLLAARAGFPFAKTIGFDLEQYGYELSNFETLRRNKFPLIRFSYPTPQLGIFQPILPTWLKDIEKSDADVDFFKERLICWDKDYSNKKGLLFKETSSDGFQLVKSITEKIDPGSPSKNAIFSIEAQKLVYELQIWFAESLQALPIVKGDFEIRQAQLQMWKRGIQLNRRFIKIMNDLVKKGPSKD